MERDLNPEHAPFEPVVSYDTVALDSVRLYLNEAARYKLLTAEQEIEKAQRIEAGHAAQAVLTDDERLTPLELDAISELERVVADGNAARQEMINANLRLVTSIAKRYRASQMPLQDLIQEGNLGLMTAVDKFDWRLGYKLSTYATWWIKQSITRAIAYSSSTIRLPMHLRDEVRRFQTQVTLLSQQTAGPVSDEIISQGLNISPDRIRHLKDTAYRETTISLDSPIGVGADAHHTIGDRVADITSNDGYEQVDSEAAYENLLELLRGCGLEERECDVLIMRHVQGMSLEQVGQIYNVSRERIRQIESRAKRKAIFKLPIRDPDLRARQIALRDTMRDRKAYE